MKAALRNLTHIFYTPCIAVYHLIDSGTRFTEMHIIHIYPYSQDALSKPDPDRHRRLQCIYMRCPKIAYDLFAMINRNKQIYFLCMSIETSRQIRLRRFWYIANCIFTLNENTSVSWLNAHILTKTTNVHQLSIDNRNDIHLMSC